MQQKIKFTPEEAHELRLKQNRENSSQLQVDSSLFYLDHCKKHPIDLALEKIKSYAENKNWDHNYVILGPNMFFENLDYEEKKIKKTGDWPETFWQRVFHKNVHHEWEETDHDGRDDGFILGTIVYSRGYLAISTSRWNASSYALDSCDMEIFDWKSEWNEAFEFFWEKILMVPGWDNENYEDQLIFEPEKYCLCSYFVIKGSRFGD